MGVFSIKRAVKDIAFNQAAEFKRITGVALQVPRALNLVAEL